MLYYEIKGEGFPIVCIHGNGENHHIFDELSNYIEGYQLILPDSRYHGKSKGEGELTYDAMTQDIIDLCDYLELKEYGVIGFSDGGIIALKLGMKDQKMSFLISLGANTKPQNVKTIFYCLTWMQYIFLMFFSLYHPVARKKRKFYRLMLKEPHINYDDLKNIQIPALIMAGEHDLIKESDTRMIADSLPYSSLKIIPMGNHFLLRDSFKETKMEITLFLRAFKEIRND